jgi:hypothetical protein
MIKRVCVFLICCLAVSSQTWASTTGTPETTDPGKEKSKAVSIAMFIPGLQQLESRRYIKGALLLGFFAGCIAGAVIHNSKGNNWYEKYRTSTDVDEIIMFRQNTESSFKKRNLFMVGVLTVWLAHIVDLKFFKSKNGGVKGEAGKNSFNVHFYYAF